MTAKQLQTAKAVVIVILAGFSAYAVPAGKYWWLVIAFVVAAAVLIILRRRVKEVLADERDKGVAGQAALIAMYSFCWLAALLALITFAMRGVNQYNETIALTLAYSAAVIMLVYTLSYRFYDRVALIKQRGLYVAVTVIVLALVVIAGLRLLSPEDEWRCENGQIIKHGNPSKPMPGGDWCIKNGG